MNIAHLIREQAIRNPDKAAAIFPSEKKWKNRSYQYQSISFRQLDQDSDHLARQLQKHDIRQGSRVLLFIRPSPEFSLTSFALFKLGAVPVLIDPGMGLKKLLHAVRQVAPDSLIAVPQVCLIKKFCPGAFGSVKQTISSGALSLPGIPSLHRLLQNRPSHDSADPFPIASCLPATQAAVLFTSGGTGSPKGVEYTHGIFETQIRLLKDMFQFTDADKDMPAFPLFSLMTQAMGVCSVIPPMNPAKPARANPAKLVQVILDQGVTTAAGSPAIWQNVGRYCIREGLRLPSLRALMMFGAPVSGDILHDFSVIMPTGDTWTPYGATECLPVSCIRGQERLEEQKTSEKPAMGVCVGFPVMNTRVRIIQPSDTVFQDISQTQEQKTGETGEIIVQGAQVTPSYVTHPEASRDSKIPDSNGGPWHRMGDLGFFDTTGRLWFCGRKAHRVCLTDGTWLDSVPGEAAFNQHPDIRRSALIPYRSGKQTSAALVIERKDQKTYLPRSERQRFRKELSDIAATTEATRKISAFYLSGPFPTDTRHNIKIDRILLARKCQENRLRTLS
ncbi:MAG: AMP-binding protein [Deltaproteobacteria bacterium]|nr:AMP-binding protein [Deltaproteobacteria bacterium]